MAAPGRPRTSEELARRGRALGQRLKAAREERFGELSEEQFAARAGLSVHTLRKLESTTANPGFFTVADLAEILGLDMRELARITP